jgi:hypothetical protein
MRFEWVILLTAIISLLLDNSPENSSATSISFVADNQVLSGVAIALTKNTAEALRIPLYVSPFVILLRHHGCTSRGMTGEARPERRWLLPSRLQFVSTASPAEKQNNDHCRHLHKQTKVGGANE